MTLYEYAVIFYNVKKSFVEKKTNFNNIFCFRLFLSVVAASNHLTPSKWQFI